MQQYSIKYVFLFAAAICAVCSMMISVAAVSLNERQERNKTLDRQKSVLQAAGLIASGESPSAEEVQGYFENIETKYLDLDTNEYVDESVYDEAAQAPAPDNSAGIQEVPKYVQIYQIMKDGQVDALVLPIYGKGLWSTLYGYMALESDGTTVRGLIYYQHGETPGLGGEVDNPKWKAKWPGRKVYKDGEVALSLRKGEVGPPAEDPYAVDALSGATITSRGVTNMIEFWLGEQGLGGYLDKFEAQQGSA